jgi:hypothetical protein
MPLSPGGFLFPVTQLFGADILKMIGGMGHDAH